MHDGEVRWDVECKKWGDMELTLTPEIERALKVEARQRGVTPEQLALASLRKAFVTMPTPTASGLQDNLADFLNSFIGSLRSSEAIPGGAYLSENSGSHFAKLMLKKRKEGHL